MAEYDDARALEDLLDACASEPIHAPGAVQPHGALLVLDDAGVIRSASANLAEVLGPAGAVDAASALGRTVADALGPAWGVALDQALQGGVATVHPQPEGAGSTAFECVAERSGSRVLFEVEPDPGGHAAAGDERLFRMLDDFHGATSIDELVGGAVATVAQLTGFDRVLCYRFDPDWNGEVVAEVDAPGTSSFAGLRFPASDIPAQARAQYARTPLRLIPDSSAVPSPLLAQDATWAELDLSDASLRAVSPVHLQYLRNMGVAASMSVSLTVGGRLWGIIAGHHLRGPARPSRRVRQAVRLVARTTSTVLAVLLASDAAERRLERIERLDRLSDALHTEDDRPSAEVLRAHGDAVRELVEASGFAVVGAKERTVVGDVPPDAALAALVARARAAGGVLADAELGAAPGAVPGAPGGALVVPVGGVADRWLLWFRPEVARTVQWAGEPAKRADEVTGRLEPRSSFDAYIEEIRGRSEPWVDEDVDIAVELAARVTEADGHRVRREAQIAQTLQQTLMLERFPNGRGMAGAARYRPASNSPLGGDWYDVFFLPNGTSIVAVGDVAGHGFEVAATMAQLRHALRAYLVRAESFDEALSKLNELLVTLLPSEMATVVLAEVDGARGTVRVANAGHLPAVVSSPAGAHLVEVPGPALGWESGVPHRAVDVPMAPHDRLVLYSDGLIERRERPIDESLAALVAAADATAALGVEEQVDALLTSLTEGTDVDDDVTVVVVELVPEAAPVSPAPGSAAGPG